MELALHSQQQEKEGEFLQVAHGTHGAVHRSLAGIPGWKEPQDASSSSLEHPGVPEQRGTEIKEIILWLQELQEPAQTQC